MELSLPQASLPSLHGVPFDQKWELLKPTIERLYIHEERKLPDVIELIRSETEFDARSVSSAMVAADCVLGADEC